MDFPSGECPRPEANHCCVDDVGRCQGTANRAGQSSSRPAGGHDTRVQQEKWNRNGYTGIPASLDHQDKKYRRPGKNNGFYLRPVSEAAMHLQNPSYIGFRWDHFDHLDVFDIRFDLTTDSPPLLEPDPKRVAWFHGFENLSGLHTGPKHPKHTRNTPETQTYWNETTHRDYARSSRRYASDVAGRKWPPVAPYRDRHARSVGRGAHPEYPSVGWLRRVDCSNDGGDWLRSESVRRLSGIYLSDASERP